MAVHYSILLLRPLFRIALAALLCAVASDSTLRAADDANQKKAKVTYDDHVRPLLKRRCASCHSGDRTEADLNIANFVALMQGGGSGAVIDAGSADDSYLFRLVNHDDSPEMPPGGSKIPDLSLIHI